MIVRRARGNRGGEWNQIGLREAFRGTVENGQVFVRVHLRIAVAGEMFRAPENSGAGEAAQTPRLTYLLEPDQTPKLRTCVTGLAAFT